MNIAQIIDPAYLPLALENMQRRLRGEATEAPLEFLTRAKDGSPRWVEVVSGPIVAHGAVVGFQGIVRDIGERKAAEDRLGLQAQLLDTVSQAIMVTNHRGSITYWNRYAQTLFGYSEADAVGVTALRLVAPQSRTLAVEAITRVLGGEHWSGELIACRKDGTAFPALVIGTPLYDAAGELIGTVGVAADISQLRHAEQQATFAREQAAVLEERARIAHDLHDNVAQFFFGIGIASKDLLERTSVTPTTLRRRLEHIRRLASEGGREVRRAVSALTPAQRPGGIEAWIQSLADEARATGGLEVEYAPEGSAALLSADVQNHLYRAAQEALYNVRKHARASSVCVGLRVDRNTATLQVADKGQGTAEEIERAVARGAGFGLRSLRDQFEKCGGRLVVSNNDGGGIIVTFELPASAGT